MKLNLVRRWMAGWLLIAIVGVGLTAPLTAKAAPARQPLPYGICVGTGGENCPG